MVYGEPDEKVPVTVDPEVGTAVTVLDVVTPSFVKEMEIDVDEVAVTLNEEGALGLWA